MDASLASFLFAITLLTLTPGVDTLLVIRNTRRGGWRDGAFSSLGICSGLFFQALISALGVSLLLLQSAWLFSALKLAGAAYLTWLGVNTLYRALQRRQASAGIHPASSCGELRVRRSLTEGFLSNVLNPKTVVFYMALLPQFIDPQQAAAPQMLYLAAIHFVIAMVWQCLLAVMISRSARWFDNRKAQLSLDTLTASVLIALGGKLALER